MSDSKMPDEPTPAPTYDPDDLSGPPKTLHWGETPFTHMTRDELMREMQRAYAACVSARSCLRIARSLDEGSSYWGPNGSGGRALEQLDQVVEPHEAQYGSEAIYRMFFRYATDLLFDVQRKGFRIGSGWVICPECGVMLGRHMDEDRAIRENGRIGKPCADAGLTPGCSGTFRKLDWRDLEPKAEGAQSE